MIARSLPPSVTSGHTSAQYLVQATMRSSWPMAARITVALGCRQTTRCEVESLDTDSMVQLESPCGGGHSCPPPLIWTYNRPLQFQRVLNQPCTSTCSRF